jgi:hypothetical protein
MISREMLFRASEILRLSKCVSKCISISTNGRMRVIAVDLTCVKNLSNFIVTSNCSKWCPQSALPAALFAQLLVSIQAWQVSARIGTSRMSVVLIRVST